MKMNQELIGYLEELSKLRLTDGEKRQILGDLERILGHVDTLCALDTDGVEELSHPFPSVNAFRADVVEPSLERDQILAGAKEQKDGCFQVPKTVE